MKTKTMLFAICISLMASLFPAAAFAAENDYPEQGFSFADEYAEEDRAFAVEDEFPADEEIIDLDAVWFAEDEQEEAVVKAANSAAGDSMESAAVIELSEKYSGIITENQDKFFYRFTLPASGKVTLKATAYMEWINYRIFDSEGNELWGCYPSWNETTETISTLEAVDLTKGIYYFVVEKDWSTGNYNFTLSFDNAKESFKESGNGNDNSMSASDNVSLNSAYKGQLAINDEKDFYRFVIDSSGRITLKASAYMENIRYRIFDSKGNELWERCFSWNDTTEKISTSETVDLTKGTYYFVAEKDWDKTGNYSFSLNYESAGESFSEKDTGTDNSMSKANAIKMNKNYKGQIAVNDDRDFYRFTMTSAGIITLKATAYAERIDYKIYDSEANEVWSNNGCWHWNTVTGKSTVKEYVSLSKGTYYFVAEKDWDYTGQYSFSLSAQKTQPMTVTGKTITVKSSALKKAGKTFTKSSAFAVSKAKGSISFKKVSGSGKITVSRNGRITVKKGTAKGTYKIKVKVTAAGNNQYKKGAKTVTITVRVK